MASTIGIKIANGNFFPIIEEPSPAAKEKFPIKKKLVLTTVRDSQESMQIDLYRSQRSGLAGAQYVGSIVVKDIKPKTKGDPSVEMVISLDEDGALSATAADLDASAKGGYQHLDVFLKLIDIDSQGNQPPNYRMDQVDPPPQGLYQIASQIREREKKKFPWIIIIIIGIVIILAGLGVWFFLAGVGMVSPAPVSAPEVVSTPEAAPILEAAPVPEAATVPEAAPVPEVAPIPEAAPVPEPPAGEPDPLPPPVVEAEPEPPPVPVIEPVKPVEAPPVVSRERRSTAPVSSYKVPAHIPKGGVAYRIRWGDTLWDISEAFYRNPWLYRRIARYNGIRNPDLIMSGTIIRIPPRN